MNLLDTNFINYQYNLLSYVFYNSFLELEFYAPGEPGNCNRSLSLIKGHHWTAEMELFNPNKMIFMKVSARSKYARLKVTCTHFVLLNPNKMISWKMLWMLWWETIMLARDLYTCMCCCATKRLAWTPRGSYDNDQTTRKYQMIINPKISLVLI